MPRIAEHDEKLYARYNRRRLNEALSLVLTFKIQVVQQLLFLFRSVFPHVLAALRDTWMELAFAEGFACRLGCSSTVLCELKSQCSSKVQNGSRDSRDHEDMTCSTRRSRARGLATASNVIASESQRVSLLDWVRFPASELSSSHYMSKQSY